MSADNFYEQTEAGVVCVFSLKNPSYPEFLCHAPCGVMCLDFHPEVTHNNHPCCTVYYTVCVWAAPAHAGGGDV